MHINKDTVDGLIARASSPRIASGSVRVRAATRPVASGRDLPWRTLGTPDFRFETRPWRHSSNSSDISKRFGGVQALRDVDLAVEAGEVHCLVGENGSGKSTLIKIISGVQAPEPGGAIVIAGQDYPHLNAGALEHALRHPGDLPGPVAVSRT